MKSLGAIFQAAPEPSRSPMTPEETAAALRRLMGAGQGNGVGQLSKMFATPPPSAMRVGPDVEPPLDAKAAVRLDESLRQLNAGKKTDVERMRAFIRSLEEE